MAQISKVYRLRINSCSSKCTLETTFQSRGQCAPQVWLRLRRRPKRIDVTLDEHAVWCELRALEHSPSCCSNNLQWLRATKAASVMS